MRNKLLAFIREQAMLRPGDRVICAVSGGADSMALLWCMYLLKDKLGILLEAAHFNHNLRGAESDGEQAFVTDFCRRHGIVCHVGSGTVCPDGRGLEAAARDARYGFLQSLPGKIATAHTADDNAETLIMHLIRGTGLKGLGGIAPVREDLIRPMLTVTRRDVLEFLRQENIPFMNDSSNETDEYLRNRIRHHVMPLLKAENPSLAENLSATALQLRQDSQTLDRLAEPTDCVETLRSMPPALQTACLGKLLTAFGVREPERTHIRLLRQILLSDNPSAYGVFPGGILIGRRYDRLIRLRELPALQTHSLNCPGMTRIPELGLRVRLTAPGEDPEGTPVRICGTPVLRGRREGDRITLSGGTVTLKKLFISKKIPAAERNRIPVIADEAGIALVAGIGPDRNRMDSPNWAIRFETEEEPAAAEK